MIKIRVSGLSEEVEEMVQSLKQNYCVMYVSGEYENRNSEYVRVYVELEQSKIDN
jgi:hypothetical protein